MASIDKQVLSDFISTVDKYPEISSEEALSLFPEFGGDTNILQSAMDFRQTYKDNPNMDDAEMKSLFPEFFANNTVSPTTTVPSDDTISQANMSVADPMYADALQERKEEIEKNQHAREVNAAQLPMMAEQQEQLARYNLAEFSKIPARWTMDVDSNGIVSYGMRGEGTVAEDIPMDVPGPLQGAGNKFRENALNARKPYEEAQTLDDVRVQIIEAEEANTEEGRRSRDEREALHNESVDRYQGKLEEYKKELIGSVRSGDMTVDEANEALSNREREYIEKIAAIDEEAYKSFAKEALERNANFLEKESMRIGNEIIDSDIEELMPRIREKFDEGRQAAFGEAHFDGSPARFTGSADEVRERSEELRDRSLYNGAYEFLTDAKKIRDAVKEKKAWYANLGGGVADSITDEDTWDFGIGKLMQSKNMKQIQEKLDANGGDDSKLSEAERDFMQAAYTYLETCALNSGKLNKWYKAGQTTGKSIPFMLEFAIMPLEGIEHAVANSVVRFGTRMFGRVAGNGMRYTLRQTIGKTIGLGVAALTQTAVFGGADIEAGSLERQTGKVKVGISDDERKLVYEGIERGSKQGEVEATLNAFADTYIENLSEMIFTAGNPIKTFMSKRIGMSRMFKDITSKNWVRTILEGYNNPVLRDVRKRVQFGGYAGEVLEEEIGGLMRFVCSDVRGADNPWEAAGLSKDEQADILLGLLPTSVFFLGIGGASSAIHFAKTKYNTADLLKRMPTDTERTYYKYMIESPTLGEYGDRASDYIRQVVNSDLTPVEKSIRLDYALGQFYQAMTDKVKTAAKAVAEERFGTTVTSLAESISASDGNVYMTTDAKGRPVYLTGEIKTKQKDGVTFLDMPKKSNVTSVFFRKDGIQSIENNTKAGDFQGPIEVRTKENMRGWLMGQAEAIMRGDSEFVFDGKTYDTYSLEEKEPASTDSSTPNKADTQASGSARITKQIRAVVKITDPKTKTEKRVTLYFNAPNGYKLNGDGSIDMSSVSDYKLTDYQGKEIGKNLKSAYMDAFNATLRMERDYTKASANEYIAKKAEEKLNSEKAARDEEARKKKIADYIASVKAGKDGKGWKIKDGVIDKDATPQQKFVWNLETYGEEEAMKRAARAVGESVYELEKLEDDTTIKSEEKDRLGDIARFRIKGYEEAVRNILGEQSVVKLSQDASREMAQLIQRDLESEQEAERKRAERIAERERRRQANREALESRREEEKKLGKNLDNSENNSNFAENSNEDGNNTGANNGVQGGSQNGVPKTAVDGQAQSGGNQQGNGGIPPSNGQGDNQRDREGVQAGLLSTHPDDIIDVERDANDAVHELLQKHGLSYSKHRVFQVTGSLFQQVIQREKVKNPKGWMVSVHPLESDEYEVGYNDCKCYLTADGLSGIAITPTGDIISLFSSVSGDHRMEKLIAWALTHGGKKADCYANGLESLYARFGGKVVSQTPFVEKFAPDDWDKESRGQVVFLIFPSVEEALQTYADYKKQGVNLPEVNLSEEAVRNFPDEDNGYAQAGEYRDKVLSGEITPDTNQTDTPAEPASKPIDLREENILIVKAPSGSGWAVVRVDTDEAGNTKITPLVVQAPNGRSVRGIVGYDGKVAGDRGAWIPVEKSTKMVYVNNVPYYILSNYEIAIDEKGNVDTNMPSTEGVNAVRADQFTGVVETLKGLQVKVGDEFVPLHKKVEEKTPQSVDTILDTPVYQNSQISITLRQLFSEYQKHFAEGSKKDAPFANILEVLVAKLNPKDNDEKGEITRSLVKGIRSVLNMWNSYVGTYIGDSIGENEWNSLSNEAKAALRYMRYVIYRDSDNLAERNSLKINENGNADIFTKKNMSNPIFQLAYAMSIAKELGYMPDGFAINVPDVNIQRVVSRKEIENARARYEALGEGAVQPNYDTYPDGAKEEMRAMETLYPEVLNNDEPHVRLAITEENEKQVKKEMQEQKMLRKTAKKVAKTGDQMEDEQIAALQKSIDDGFAKVEKARDAKDAEGFAKAVAELSPLLSGNKEAQERLQSIIADAAAQEKENATPPQPEQETPAEPAPAVTNEEPAAEPAPQAEVEVPAPAKRRRKSRKAEQTEKTEETGEQPAGEETPIAKLSRMVREYKSLYKRYNAHDESVTADMVDKKDEAIMDFISENGDTNELWNAYNDAMASAEFQASPEQIATTERSRAIGGVLVRMIGHIRGAKIHMLNSQEEVMRILASYGTNVEDLKTPGGTIYGFAIGDEIYITPEGMNADTPIHEYTHLWVKSMRANNPKLWKKIVKELKQNKALWGDVTKDENYKDLTSDDAIASEVLARFSGKKGAELLEKLAKDQKLGTEKLERAFIERARRALRSFWQWVWEKLGGHVNYNQETIDDFADMVLRDLFDGKDLEIVDNSSLDEMDAIREQAIKDGTFMKAPNGAQSNLPEKLWLLVRTKNFKKWFGDWENDPLNASKVVDENGEPLVVYHGTPNAGFNIFSLKGYSNGFYTTENRHAASGYANFHAMVEGKEIPDAQIGEESNLGVYSLFANIKNPLRIDFADENGNKRKWDSYPTGKWAVVGDEELGIEDMMFATEEAANTYLAQFGTDQKPYPVMMTTDDFVRKADESGFDGCIFTNVYDGNRTINEDMTDYVALHPNQLKSTHNVGFFSAIDDRIEYSRAERELHDWKPDVEQKINEEEMQDALADVESSNEERFGLAHWAAMRILDRMEGMRLIQNSIARFREMNGLESQEDIYDIRNLFESKDAAARNKYADFMATYERELDLAIEELRKQVEKSDFYKNNKVEKGGAYAAELTPIQFIERYLMARNNIERAKENKARGLGEFKKRMGAGTIEFVEKFQDSYDSALILNLWDKIEQVTNFTLDTALKGHLITNDEYERLKAKKFYIPQRGFWEEVSPSNPNNSWWEKTKTQLGYASELGPKINVHTRDSRKKNRLDSMQKAEGGKSLAEGCLAYIKMDAMEAIEKGEDNKVKVALFEYLRSNAEWCSMPENNFPVPREVSYRINPETGEVERLENGLTREEKELIRETKRRINELEEQLQTADEEEKEILLIEINQLEDSLPAFDEYDARRIYASNRKDSKRNTIGVLVNGVQNEIVLPEKFYLTADALNGIQDKKGELSAIKKISSFLAAQFTVNNPTFFAVNLVRDTAFVTLKGTAEYGVLFAGHFYKNLAACQIVLNNYLFNHKMGDVTGEQNMDNWLAEFLQYGGNTGMMNQKNLEKFRADMTMLDMSAGSKAKKVAAKSAQWLLLQPLANHLNEWSELTTRFAIYATAREMGMNINEGIKAAHNLSVNFNRRGLGSQFLNLFSSLTVFVNATLQGTTGFWRTFYDRKEPVKKALKAGTIMAMAPAFLGFLNTLLLPDDDGEEIWVSDWDRDNYVIIPYNLNPFTGKPGGGRIPLAQEIRPFWCIGVNIAMLIKKRRTPQQAIYSICSSLLLNGLPAPQNIAEALRLTVANMTTDEYHNIGEIFRAVMTPAMLEPLEQLADNRNFLGGKTRYDIGDIPEYQMAPNASALAQDLSYAAYVIGGGDTESPGKTRGAKYGYDRMPRIADINPKEFKNYLFAIPTGYLDALCLSYGFVKDVALTVFGDEGNDFGDNIDIKHSPVVNKFYHEMSPDIKRYTIKREAKKVVKEYEDAITQAHANAERYKVLRNKATDERDIEALTKHVEASVAKERALLMQGKNINTLKVLIGYSDQVTRNALRNKLHLVSDKELEKVLDDKTLGITANKDRELTAAMAMILYNMGGLEYYSEDKEFIQKVQNDYIKRAEEEAW